MSGRSYPNFGARPRLLLAYADPTYASECGRYFRRLGWEVQLVASGAEARRLAHEYHPNVVALDADLLEESGWLTGAKITSENPESHIVLVANDRVECSQDRLRLVGAQRSVRRTGGAAALADTILGEDEAQG